MSGFGSEDLDLGICLRLGLRSWISGLRSKDLDSWFWCQALDLGFRCLGLSLRIWTSEFGSQNLDL